MTRARGADTIDQLIAKGRLEHVTAAAADGSGLLRSAVALLNSAARESDQNPEAAYVLAYDSARKAATALLAQQGLRAKPPGHHVTVEKAVRSQFNGPFEGFGPLRRRRGEIEYPQRPGDQVSPEEAVEAISVATDIAQAATRLIGELGLYG